MLSLLCFTITSQAQTKTEEIDFTRMSGRGIEVKEIERSGVILLFDGGKDTTYVPAFYEKKGNEEAALRMYYGNILTIKGKQSKIKEIHFKFATKAKTKLTRRIQRANALRRKVIKSFRKNTQKEYKNLIFLLVED